MKNYLGAIPLSVLLCFCVSCLPEDWDTTFFGRNPPQNTSLGYRLEQIKAQPLDFQIPASEDADAWKRAHLILDIFGNNTPWCSRERRAPMDNVIEVDPTKDFTGWYQDLGFLYRIVRTQHGEMTHYKVCYAPYTKDHSSSSLDKTRAKVIAYFIASGVYIEEAMNDDRIK